MTKRYLLLTMLAAMFLCGTAEAAPPRTTYTWDYPDDAPTQDMPADALLHPAAFKAWRARYAAVLRAAVEAVPLGAPSPAVAGAPQARAGYTLRQLDFPFADGLTISSLLAVPKKIDPSKPVIVAIHGHELNHWGEAPYELFDHDWAERWAQAGYVVWAPSHLWYTQLASLYAKHDYPIVWVRMLERLFDASRRYLPAHSGYVATGHSAGGLSASMLVALRPEFRAGVFSGSFIPLDYLRETYRIAGHPNNWDIRGILSYDSIYALMAPRPVQWQIGKEDPFFPRNTGQPASGCCYTGTDRGVSVTETFGELFVLRKVWAMTGGPQPQLDIHKGGHVYDFPAALTFVRSLGTPRDRRD